MLEGQYLIKIIQWKKWMKETSNKSTDNNTNEYKWYN